MPREDEINLRIALPFFALTRELYALLRPVDPARRMARIEDLLFGLLDDLELRSLRFRLSLRLTHPEELLQGKTKIRNAS